MNNHLIAMHEPFALEFLERLACATPEERMQAREAFATRNSGDPENDKIYTIDGSVATMIISGPLSRKGPSALMLYFGYGGTGYNAIIEAAAEIKANDSVEKVKIKMETPGGFIDGLDEAFQALDDLNKSKKITVINQGMIASAGYYLAVAASKIEAVSPAVVTGSIGVKVVGYDWTGYLAKEGIVKRVIISSNAPKKSPGIETKQGRDHIQADLDAQERIFLMRVSEGRGVSVETVKSDFGQGAVLVAFDPDPSAADALSAGMIDEITGGQIGVFESNEDDSDKKNTKGKLSLVSRSDKSSQRQQKKCGQSSASDQETHTVSKTLKELLAENSGAKSEHDAALVNAKTTGFTTGKAEGLAESKANYESRAKIAGMALSADKAYPKSITALAAKVMTGETDPVALQSAMAAVDAVREEAASDGASKETKKLGKTGGDQQQHGKVDGVAETEDDFQAQLNAATSGGK